MCANSEVMSTFLPPTLCLLRKKQESSVFLNPDCCVCVCEDAEVFWLLLLNKVMVRLKRAEMKDALESAEGVSRGVTSR